MTDFNCRICKANHCEEIMSFGEVALSDAFLPDPLSFKEEKRYPLTLVICQECCHVQIKEILDPKLLFSKYPWETGIPASIKQYCRDFADSSLRKLQPNQKRVLEIASNDGTMLKEFQRRGYDVLGVDPAENIAKKANTDGIQTIDSFFNEKIAAIVLETMGEFDLIIARNVLAHVADLHGLVRGIKLLLASTGVAIIEVPQLLTMYNELQYDQVFHEHIGYHSLDSVSRVFWSHGLKVVDAEETWIHGGSIRVYICHTGRNEASESQRVHELLSKESQAGILDPNCWASFGERARLQREQLRNVLQEAVANGSRIAGYGASGKGQTMLQFCGLNSELVSFIADKSTYKIGKFTPGSHIPVISPEQMRQEDFDVLVLFAWNFADEILQQESSLRDKGVKFLHPLPNPRVISC
ncbi:MAG: class I SAM-dependent methyltransferase [Cyanobacteriota bacterium]|nr:class I SAM-dependent methyltransferase [Cyanobacteriota bacterium]